jgi:3-deoxy-manno-octulosonate cytidylyltransferase (CMP-KDO synthetase)
MSFTVIIPARMASTRLPDKPLADLGGKPMVVRVAERAAQAGAERVLVATDDPRIVAACERHGFAALLTRADHVSGTDRIAEAAASIGLAADAVVVNVQGDEPLIDPALIVATAALIHADCPMATAAHPLETMEDLFNPNVVKLVTDRAGRALYFSRAAIPWHRDGFGPSTATVPVAFPGDYAALRHIGLYAYTNAFLQKFPQLEVAPLENFESLEQLRALWHGVPIAVHVAPHAPMSGVDTPEDLARVREFFRATSERA